MIINLNKKLMGKPSEEVIIHFLGNTARLLSSSKSRYREKYPGHKIFFNACIFDKNFKQIWFGDIDFFNDEETLQEFADFVGEELYITTEQPYRWYGLNESIVKNDKEVVVFKPK